MDKIPPKNAQSSWGHTRQGYGGFFRSANISILLECCLFYGEKKYATSFDNKRDTLETGRLYQKFFFEKWEKNSESFISCLNNEPRNADISNNNIWSNKNANLKKNLNDFIDCYKQHLEVNWTPSIGQFEKHAKYHLN